MAVKKVREQSMGEIQTATVVIDDSEPAWEDVTVTAKEIPVIPLVATESYEDVHIQGTEETVVKIKELVARYADVFTDVPEITNLETCRIKTKDEKPVRVRHYPLPYSQRETVRQEIKAMIEMGAIEPSISPYASAVVLVKKRMGRCASV